MATQPAATPRPSYRALLDVPSLARVLVGMSIARIGGGMLSVALVLFTLEEFGSPALAGIVTFVAIFPGILVSPIAGALLDRHGRSRLVVLDYVFGAASLALIGGLARAGSLTPLLLIAIAAASSLTTPLSTSGLRSLLPLMVPKPLWERANAVDSNGYVLATLIGPPLAGGLVQLAGGAEALFAVAALLVAAAVVLVGIPDPPTDSASTGNLLVDAWRGLVYTMRNPTLRGLGLSISTLNLGGGMLAIVVPIVVIDRLGYGAAVAGLAWAASGLAGMVAAFFFGRWDSRGRERQLLVWPMVGYGLALLLLMPIDGIVLVFVGLAVTGFLNGPMDIGLFTVRQRRTDPAWMGRAFAVSMAFNFMGFPIGSALAGALVSVSLVAAVAFGVVAALLGAAIAWLTIPAVDERAGRTSDETGAPIPG
ncbi:MAG TPA: MFS transporter [Candidatus Limnocylindrales bacterium]|nr:MFS transporter [Candidatus Limnocylindrales bacterium]